ncbi:MAG: hypothetical protein MI861_00230 [Pirellulales bacterium]|nr:hypothetical protein [Pirellulales bacterium]
MRLTLRTLLAYLDNTLDPQDVKVLREKLEESGFATQLVQRIRGSLANASFSAPSPQAVGPVEDANVISEYLDSTLPVEQVAEIERACLESDPHLAEAAACHQILTLVLDQPAEVSQELRERIYQLPDNDIEKIAAASGSFSSLAIPDEPMLGGEPVSPDAMDTASGESIQPVGVADSGVSDAPTRLRQSGVSRNGSPGGGAMAGSSPRPADEQTRIYGGSIRTSRVAPWLVSLGLVAVLLFALIRIFEPLLWPAKMASDSTNDSQTEVDQDASPAESEKSQSPSAVPAEKNAQDESAGTPQESDQTQPRKSGDTQATASVDADQANQADAPAENANDKPSVDSPGEASPSTTTDDSTTTGTNQGEPTNVADVEATGQEVKPAEVSANPENTAQTEPMPSGDQSTVEVTSQAPAVPTDVEPAPSVEVAKVISEGALLVSMAPTGQWVRLKKNMPVGEDQKVICAPTFRGKVQSAAKVNVTMVGAAQIRWVSEGDFLTLHVDFGRVLINATEPDVSLSMVLGDLPVDLELADIDTVIAANVTHFRAPGFDPLVKENRTRLAGVLVVQGSTKLTSELNEAELITGQKWVRRGDMDPTVSLEETVPDWIDPPNPDESSLDAEAREGLMALLGDAQAIDLALREATGFRRAEVAALAAQSLLLMGLADVYFGGDGIFSQPKQRAHWPEHFQVLLEVVDRDSESAAEVNRSVANMDSANSREIIRLLAGYSQKQLVEGGDEQLVQFLNSTSMAVRVLALENLHRITGTTLYFRAEQDNAIRRAAGIKKWEARQRKGDIRWQP